MYHLRHFIGRYSLSLALMIFATAPAAFSEEQSVWEAGIAIGGATLPHYMGSDERYTFAAPIPYIIYRGERLRLDRHGLHADLFGIGGLSMDASLGIGLPVKNSNRARAGMPALHFSLQAGPRINWQFLDTGSNQYTLRLPWRGVMDIRGHYLGWVSEPDIEFTRKINSALSLRVSTGLLFASRQYNEHYYGVAPLYATPDRPAYKASGGLHSTFVRSTLSWKISDRLSSFAAVRYRNLSSGTVASSPLVKTPHYLSAAVGLAWSFYQSDEKQSNQVDTEAY